CPGTFDRRWKRNGPGQVAGPSVAAAVEQTTNPSERVPERDTWRNHVKQLPNLQFFEPCIQHHGQGSGDESAVEDQPTMLDHEYFPEGFVRELLTPEGQNIEHAWADNPADDQPGAEIQDLVRRKPIPHAPAAGGPKGGQEA